MTDDASAFIGDIPFHYDAGLGPVLFEDHAAEIARRACALRPLHVLELAAGTGIVSRKLRDGLAADADLLVTDLNAAMLDVARARFFGVERVTFAIADATHPGFDDAAFDLIVCQFGVMFFPDRGAALREALRMLRPGGSYLFSVWDRIEENPFARIAQETCIHFFPEDPPGFYRVPFSCADTARMVEEMTDAGFTDVRSETVELEKAVDDLKAFARGLVFGNPLVEEIRSRRGAAPEEVVAVLEDRLRAAFGAEPATMPLKAILFAGRR